MSANQITFSRGWDQHRKRAFGGLLSKDEARSLHDAGGVYAVILGNPEKPFAYVDVNAGKGFYGVSFLDEEQRPDLDYLFQSVRPSVLFLEQAILRRYKPGASFFNCDLTIFYFEQNGSVAIDKKTAGSPRAHRVEKNFDPSPNYEPEPSFGEYASLLRRERPLPASE